MENVKMDVVHINDGKDTLMQVPPAPKHLSTGAKKGYKMMGEFLAQAGRLKSYFLPLLEIFAEAYAEWEWACVEINRKNKIKPGSGYMQTFATQATNITTEMAIRGRAAVSMWQCAKQFGLDPKSEKELKNVTETGQMNLFEELLKSK